MTNKRIIFDTNVVRTIAGRANNQCSVPRCNRPALGPAVDSTNASVNMGTACHIYSAAKNGPRGWGDKLEEWIGSAENGIWCCNYHGTRIDKRQGREFPVDDLLAWKALAEARVAKQMNDQPSPLGWVEKLEFDNFAIFKSTPELKLSRFTLVTGEEGSGKSLLYEMAATISDSKYGNRFISCSKSSLVKGTVTYSTVEDHQVKLKLEFLNSKMKRFHNDRLLNMPPNDIEVIYFPSELENKRKEEDDLQFMMRILKVDQTTLETICNELGSNSLIKGEFWFEPSKYEDDESGNFLTHSDGSDFLQLSCKLEGRSFDLPFNSLSRSESLRIIISFFIIKAREYSKQKLTLFLLETDGINFDINNFKKLLNVLLEQPFQVALNVPNGRFKDIIDVDESGVMNLKSDEYLERWSLSQVVSEKFTTLKIR